ncbi:uncharacterized protein [Rutidosis leptorrhynchoides]|uniref:uncharacterized protein n=1 Tax=Rutidosis leptorrhynchoides TaxID=125765 RepID=UPI003A9933B7
MGNLILFEGSDAWVWSLSNNVGYSVSDTRSHVDEHVLPSSLVHTMWLKQIPRKINIFIWRLSLDRLPTRFNLSRRGVEIESTGCPSCNYGSDTIQHVMFACDVALELWRRVRLWVDVMLPAFSEWSV